MKLLFENWRKHTSKKLLVEIELSYQDVKNNLDKAVAKIISGHAYDVFGGPPGQEDDAQSVHREEWIKAWHTSLRDFLMLAIPVDLQDEDRAVALLWLTRLVRQTPKYRADIGLKREFDPGDAGTHSRLQRQISNNLEAFFHNRRFMAHQDLNDINSIEALAAVVAAAQDAIDAALEKKSYLNAPEGTDFFSGDWVYDENGEVVKDEETGRLQTVAGPNGWVIAALHNKGAACELGKKTAWCTARPGLDWFEKYYEPDDPLFYLEDKSAGESERFQFHYGKREFTDATNTPVGDDGESAYPSWHWAVQTLIEDEFQLHSLLFRAVGDRSSEFPNLEKFKKENRMRLLISDPETSQEEIEAVVKETLETPAGIYGGELFSAIETIARGSKTSADTLDSIANYDLQNAPDLEKWQKSALSSWRRRSDLGGSDRRTERYALASAVAENSNTSEETLLMLHDENIHYLNYAIAKNPIANDELLQQIARGTGPGANVARRRVPGWASFQDTSYKVPGGRQAALTETWHRWKMFTETH